MRRPHTYVEADAARAGALAARLVDAAIRAEPQLVLALPTGGTPVPMYAELVRLHRETRTDWSRVTTFNLDEYAGIGPEHPESYARFMEQHLFSGVNLPAERHHLPLGLAPDLEAEAARYEAAIDRAGGIDLAVLGVGVNGHVGFNEPDTELRAATHVAELALETWRRNFPDLAEDYDLAGLSSAPLRAPFRTALTMGLGTILQARRIILVATGAAKRGIVREAFTGPITGRNPASLLQLHRDVTLILDQAAS